VNNAPGLPVTVTDTSGNGNPGTYGACTYNATPAAGTLNILQGFGAPTAPLNQGFQLNQGGQQQLTFSPLIPMGMIWNVTITYTDPVQTKPGLSTTNRCRSDHTARDHADGGLPSRQWLSNVLRGGHAFRELSILAQRAAKPLI